MTDSEIREQMISARDEYIDLIKADLMGPGSEFTIPDPEHELISSSPITRYSVGILYPQGNKSYQENDETILLPELMDDQSSSEDILFDINNEEGPSRYKISNDWKDNQSFSFDETANENLDEEISMALQYLPSSMGIIFNINSENNILYISVEFATYRRITRSDDIVIPYDAKNDSNITIPDELSGIIEFDNDKSLLRLCRPINASEVKGLLTDIKYTSINKEYIENILYRFADFCSKGYVREPHKISDLIIDFSKNDIYEINDAPELVASNTKIVAHRTKIRNDIYTITIVLVNKYDGKPKADKCIFQSRITVSSDGNEFNFVESNTISNTSIMDEEELSLELLYRNKKNYGSGLGTSVNWEIDNNGLGTLWSDFFPMDEVPGMDFSLHGKELITNSELSMKYLSDLDTHEKAEKIISLRHFVQLYEEWVQDLEITARQLDAKFQSTATRHIEDCKKAYERMYRGIEILQKNENAYSAFMLANRAMFMQRIHISKQVEMSATNVDRYPGDQEIAKWLDSLNYTTEPDTNCIWRPFQIAFILMDINSMVDDDSDERNLIDLIWFPTGGGKTEAYLGLTAFTIFYRRLSHLSNSSGTTVIMRYTLRLLTSQQFNRAATLICACDYIRRECTNHTSIYPSYNLGNEPITIGLWIGDKHIPNKNKSAAKHLKELQDSTASSLESNKNAHNKFQVLKCPWCGTKLVKDSRNNELVGNWGYMMEGDHFRMVCPNEDCTFTDSLPIQIIDEELYKNPPTLLFATVDKFAMLPWNGEIGAFFGIGTDNRAPELIIQDELHLISGALGTIVGLYETAIDQICSQKGVLPKVIASTATVCRAKEQCSVLYNRQVVQFPAPGLDAEDSFFAREAKIDHANGLFGRQYIGLMPSGKTKAMTEIRAMASLLQRLYMMDLPDEVRDKFWTLTVYFNSLKDLGKAATLVADDVKDFIIRIANRLFTGRRLIINPDELTSRVSTTVLNETLDRLERNEYTQNNEKNNRASDILLATNMISVGIDIARLNVMLMVGQPKLTSEYIQASSRVGRSYPGSVFVLYDTTKSRDRSHYEQFRFYHDSFYRFVEPTGATPFSKPARERGLHAILVSMLRQKLYLPNDTDAIYFDREADKEEVQEIESFILDRINTISSRTDSYIDDADTIRLEMEDFLDRWNELVNICHEEGDDVLLYFGRGQLAHNSNKEVHRLLKSFDPSEKDSYAINTLTSMRNVDDLVSGEVLIWKDGHNA